VVVELNLFHALLRREHLGIESVNGRNNINGIGDIARHQRVYLDRSGGV